MQKEKLYLEYDKKRKRALCDFRIIEKNDIKKAYNKIENLDSRNLLSKNEIFRSYINYSFEELDEKLPEAKNFIILAIENPPKRLEFKFKNKKHSIIIPPQYYGRGIKSEEIVSFVRDNILCGTESKLEFASNTYLKTIAVGSGLGEYGLNNICYVPLMGSYLTFFGFLTDLEFQEKSIFNENMTEMNMCNSCRKCIKECPTKAISQEQFVLNVDKCLTFYNEQSNDLPIWIPKDSHNALMGCMKCQMDCPANSGLSFDSQVIKDEKYIYNFLENKFTYEAIYPIYDALGINKEHENDYQEYLQTLKRNFKNYLNLRGT